MMTSLFLFASAKSNGRPTGIANTCVIFFVSMVEYKVLLREVHHTLDRPKKFSSTGGKESHPSPPLSQQRTYVKLSSSRTTLLFCNLRRWGLVAVFEAQAEIVFLGLGRIGVVNHQPPREARPEVHVIVRQGRRRLGWKQSTTPQLLPVSKSAPKENIPWQRTNCLWA